MNSLIKIRNVTFRYEEDKKFPPTLNNVSLDIDDGSFTVILGHNGSGKSTLAKHLNAILVPNEGKITVADIDTRDSDRILDLRRTVGMVFQNPDNQMVSAIVENDVAFAPENLGIPSDKIRERVDNALKLVDMYEYRNRSPHLLSGGQKQRVAIAGVIAMQPRCIVLDEPTAMLDPSGRKEVISTIQKLCHENGITIVLITHHMSEAINADKVVVMSDGKITQQGTPSEVFSNVEELKHDGLSVPDTTELLYRLNKKGLDVYPDALNNAQCAKAIANAVNSRLTNKG